MSQTKNIHQGTAYTSLRRTGFDYIDNFIPTNHIIPTQTYLRSTYKQQLDKDEISSEPLEDLEEEKQKRAARLNCGDIHVEETNIEFMGLGERWFRRRLEKVCPFVLDADDEVDIVDEFWAKGTWTSSFL